MMKNIEWEVSGRSDLIEADAKRRRTEMLSIPGLVITPSLAHVDATTVQLNARAAADTHGLLECARFADNWVML